MPLDLFLVRHGQSEGNVALEAAKGGNIELLEQLAERSAADYRLTETREMLATVARELSGRRVLRVAHEDVMWALRFRLEKMTVEDWVEAGQNDDDAIVNCGILHYTRANGDGSTGTKFSRVRLVDPLHPERTEWRPITRPRFSNEELLDQVDKVPPLGGGEHA